MNLVDKLKDGLKIALGRKLSQSQMRNAKKVGRLETLNLKDNPKIIVNVEGCFMKYERTVLKEARTADENPLVKTVTSAYDCDGLLSYRQTVIGANEGLELHETFYRPNGSFIGSGW